jgi:hypothetical protein
MGGNQGTGADQADPARAEWVMCALVTQSELTTPPIRRRYHKAYHPLLLALA